MQVNRGILRWTRIEGPYSQRHAEPCEASKGIGTAAWILRTAQDDRNESDEIDPWSSVKSVVQQNQITTHFPVLQPPSISRLEPVTMAEMSAARYNAAAAISSGRAMRPVSCVDAISR